MDPDSACVAGMLVFHLPPSRAEKLWLEVGGEYNLDIRDVVQVVNFLLERGYLTMTGYRRVSIAHQGRWLD